MGFTPLFWACIKQGSIEYHSARTGYVYLIHPESDGFTVRSEGANLNLWTTNRRAAMCLVEMTDLASLAKKREGECLPQTG